MSSHTRRLPTLSQDRRDFVLLALAAVVWWAIYQLLAPLADWLAYRLFRLDPASHLGSAVAFFLYDVPKILLLLSGMIFLITVLRTFVTPEQTRRWLGGRRLGISHLLASALGVVTPFCSCSAVPLFIGFVESGIPLGVTFSFLITAPMVNEVALVMLLGLFGWQVAGLYLLAGVTIAVISGMVIGRLGMERYVEPFVYQPRASTGRPTPDERLTWHERFVRALETTREIVGKVWPYVVAGIGIGALIHGFIPDDFLADKLGNDSLWAVPAAVLVGIPLYSNAAGVMPIVSALMAKGVALGTVLAFMMSVIALSLPEMIILRRVLRPRLIAVYIGIVALGIMATGYLFNLIL